MSILSYGYGTSSGGFLLTLGYGAAPLILRETFCVPLPDGAQAQRSAHGAGSDEGAPYLGSLEQGVAFGLDFSGWLGANEALSALSVAARAEPLSSGRGAATDATASVVAGTGILGRVALVRLHNAQVQTVYVVTVVVHTTAGRALECRMPPIWCPD